VAYRSKYTVQVPVDSHGHHVTDVRQVPWTAVEPHPTDMPILNDAGAVRVATLAASPACATTSESGDASPAGVSNVLPLA
jgi:hypothetical protein